MSMHTQKFYRIHTFGCQMNEHDSETIAGILAGLDYHETNTDEKADLILLNTCCIREKAESKVLSYLGELKRLKATKPDLIVGVCGCMAQQKDVVELILRSAPHVGLIFGTHNIHYLPEYIKRILDTGEGVYEVLPEEERIQENLVAKRLYPYKALVNIILGCNNFCTYCIVPYVRGRERSRQLKDIQAEVEALVGDGVVEITLLGQNVNSYGQDLAQPVSFATLLATLDEIPGIERIRFMTSHPKDLSQELIATIAASKHVMPHFHLPLQSGSNQVLKQMNRKYTREDYLLLIKQIRTALPKASITTDIIVGFPGEREEDFQDTLDLVHQVKFDNAFSFIYSKRKGTPAATFADAVSLAEKKQRLQRLNEVLSTYSLQKNQEYLGKKVKVLVEGVSKTNSEMLTGRTEENKTVVFPGDQWRTGSIVWVEITEVQTWILKGSLIDEQN